MKKKLFFVLTTFLVTVVLMALQKPVFLAWHAAAAGGATFGEWCQVVFNGLRLDMTVAGYITVLPILVTLLSLWVRLPERVWSRVMMGYFVVISLLTAAVFAVDMELYKHWGYRIDVTVLAYLTEPTEALASVDLWMGVRQTLLFGLYAALMIWAYRLVMRLFDGQSLCRAAALAGSVAILLLAGLDFLAIRGGVGTSVANVSKVYFSTNMFLNHAATNPDFSLLSTLGNDADFVDEYVFVDPAMCAARFEQLRGNGPQTDSTKLVLNTTRPNVVVVILESFARSVMDAQTEGQPIMPHLLRLKEEGIWFENFYCNSYRTERGEVAVLSGFPGQTRNSIMKYPVKSRNLPSIARTLGDEGYSTSFYYGGDLNFTNQSSYLYATGWEKLVWQKDMRFDAPTSKWGYDDGVVCNYFADEVIALDAVGRPFLAGLLTLSSHAPFEVPYAKFADKQLNAMAFSDEAVGRMIDRLKASPAWENLLVVLVADHGFAYPKELSYNSSRRHHIPMLWLGGAVAEPHTVDAYASQIDICASVLAQMGLDHAQFDYSKDIFNASTPPRKFAYYVFNDGFGVVDASGEAIWDCTSGSLVSGSSPELVDIGRTMLQRTYADINRR